MSPEKINLIHTSFQQIKPILKTAGALFYKNLFEIAPELRPLFKGDIEEQGRKLMETLATVVNLLRHPEKLGPAVKQLGMRHAAYGIKDEYFAPVGTALIATLKQGLGKDFTDEVQAAWLEVYQLASQAMMQGLAEAREALNVARPLAPAGIPAAARPAREVQRIQARPWWKRLLGMR